MESKVQPGAHQDLVKQSDFRPVHKQDFLQFFGTTDNKIEDKNFIKSKQPNLGPGTYEAYSGSFQPKQARRAYTASFATNRKDILFCGNSNPGPQEYTTADTSFHSKNWQTNIGAFGTTERKFAAMQQETSSKSYVPGPGSYSAQSFVSKKFTNKKIRGQTTKVKNSQQSYTFASGSTRSFDP